MNVHMLHGCRAHWANPDTAYGPSILHCTADEEGRLWAGNDEYLSQVSFCPFCGKKAFSVFDGDEYDRECDEIERQYREREKAFKTKKVD